MSRVQYQSRRNKQRDPSFQLAVPWMQLKNIGARSHPKSTDSPADEDRRRRRLGGQMACVLAPWFFENAWAEWAETFLLAPVSPSSSIPLLIESNAARGRSTLVGCVILHPPGVLRRSSRPSSSSSGLSGEEPQVELRRSPCVVAQVRALVGPPVRKESIASTITAKDVDLLAQGSACFCISCDEKEGKRRRNKLGQMLFKMVAPFAPHSPPEGWCFLRPWLLAPPAVAAPPPCLLQTPPLVLSKVGWRQAGAQARRIASARYCCAAPWRVFLTPLHHTQSGINKSIRAVPLLLAYAAIHSGPLPIRLGRARRRA